MTTQQTAPAYQLRINLFGVSPPVWRRVRVSAGTTIAELHDIILVVMGWQDVHLHEFCIRGHAYGVRQIGAASRFAGPANLTLSAFELQHHERFTYEYDFYSCWLIEILKNELDVTDFSRDRVADLAVDWLPWLNIFDCKSINQRLRGEVYNS